MSFTSSLKIWAKRNGINHHKYSWVALNELRLKRKEQLKYFGKYKNCNLTELEVLEILSEIKKVK